MAVTNIAEASALIGRTFEGDGERATILGINVVPEKYVDLKIVDGAGERWVCLEWIQHWLETATEVFE